MKSSTTSAIRSSTRTTTTSSTPDPKLTVTGQGFFAELDQAGSMGSFAFDSDYRPTRPSGAPCAAPASPTAPTACVMRLLFRNFDDGFRGTVATENKSIGTCP